MELLVEHKKNNDTIKVLKCGAQLHSCRHNMNRFNLNKWVPDYHSIVHPNGLYSLVNCINCQERFHYGFKFMGIPPENIYDLAPLAQQDKIELPHFKNVSELKAFEFEGVDIGMAVASSMITDIDDHDFDTTFYGKLIHKEIYMAIQVLRNAEYMLETYKPDRVYLFNGRFAESRPVLRACQKKGVDAFCYEFGSVYNKYILKKNTLPHDYGQIQKEVIELWEKDDPQKYSIAQKFYEDRFKGQFQLEYQQGLQVPDETNTLPDGYNPAKRNIGLFNSSLNEYEAIPGLGVKIFPTAHAALVGIFEHFKDHPDIHFYLRIHPNLATKNNTQTRELASLNYPNLTVIPATSKINTYNVIRAMEKVICYSSATAYEAAYLKKPVISIGSSHFEHLGMCYHPASATDLYRLIEEKLSPIETEAHLMLGYYFMTFGIPYKYYKPTSLRNGSFEQNGHVFRLPTNTWYKFMMKYQNRAFRNLPFLFRANSAIHKLDLAWQNLALKPFLNKLAQKN